MKKFLLIIASMFIFSLPVIAEECESATQCAFLGKQLLDRKDYQGAIYCFDKAISFDKDEYFSYAYRAKAYYYLKNYAQFEKDVEKSLSIKPNSAAFGLNATLKLSKGDYRAAIENATDALALNPQYMKCYEVRARAKVGLEDYFSALKDITQAIKLCDYYPKNYEVRAMAYMGLKDYRTAMTDYEKAAELFKGQGDREDYKKMKKFAKLCRKRIKE
ncbi:hypothetical protein IJ707_01340 [bacterium]|nr:hypothetical protein [bacterium]